MDQVHIFLCYHCKVESMKQHIVGEDPQFVLELGSQFDRHVLELPLEKIKKDKLI